MKPKRVQLRRTKGWRKPEGCIVVSRPSKWGNPFRVGDAHPDHGWPMSREEAVALHREAALGERWPITHDFSELRGHDLACFCPLDQPCHASVLLELANA